MAGRSRDNREELTRINEDAPPSTTTMEDDSSFCSLSHMSLIQKILAEFIGAFFVIFAGCGSVTVNKMYGSVTFPGICITWGLIVMVMAYSLGHISGAHFNPAITVAFTALHRFPLKELPFYVIAQIVGAIAGSGALYLLFEPKPVHFFGTVPAGTAVQSFVLEIIISFLLMFVVCAVSTDSRAIGELAGVAVGSTILLNVFIAGPVSGASMNPARSLGPAIVMHNYKAIWAYIVGPTVGTLLGGFTYNVLRSSDGNDEAAAASNGSFLKNTAAGVGDDDDAIP